MKVNGSQVSPAELEGLLLDHQDVADVCVVGIPDEFSGEVPMAYVVISPKTLERVGSDAQALTKLKTDLMLVRSYIQFISACHSCTRIHSMWPSARYRIST